MFQMVSEYIQRFPSLLNDIYEIACTIMSVRGQIYDFL